MTVFMICLSWPFLSCNCFLFIYRSYYKRVPTEISNFFTLTLKKYIISHCFGLNFHQFDTWKDVRPVGNVFTAGGLAIIKHCEQQIQFVSNLWRIYSTMTPNILFQNQVLLVLAWLRHFSKTEDLKRFLSVWSFESFVLSCFHFYLVKRKALTKR